MFAPRQTPAGNLGAREFRLLRQELTFERDDTLFEGNFESRERARRGSTEVILSGWQCRFASVRFDSEPDVCER